MTNLCPLRRLPRRGAVALLFCALALHAAVAADDVPKPFTFARYQAMMDKSPFAVATAAVAAPVSASFAKDLYIANAAHSAEGDFVTLASTADKNFRKYLSSAAPVDGFSISGIEWSEKVGDTKVTISKDGQFATLTFNQALLSQPVAAAHPGMPPPAVPAPLAGQPATAAPLNGVPPAPQALPATTGAAAAHVVPPPPPLPTPPVQPTPSERSHIREIRPRPAAPAATAAEPELR